MKRDTRTLPACEVRFASDESGSFEGYASVWNEVDVYGDTIKSGAFKRTIAKRSGGPSMLWNHDPGQPIGVWSEIIEDARGLKVKGQLVTETVKGAEALALLKAGAISGLSIGFRAIRSERAPNGGRLLTEIELVEISLVTLPAASKARITSVKSMASPASAAAFVQAARRAALSIKGNTR